jgi:hypothetical protein
LGAETSGRLVRFSELSACSAKIPVSPLAQALTGSGVRDASVLKPTRILVDG